MRTIVVYDNKKGKGEKLFSFESKVDNNIERDIAEMVLFAEKKYGINAMLVAKHLAISKQRSHTIVEMVDFLYHPEDYTSNKPVRGEN